MFCLAIFYTNCLGFMCTKTSWLSVLNTSGPKIAHTHIIHCKFEHHISKCCLYIKVRSSFLRQQH
uniref:Uncharacterized protein n=1 Tax=Zea mays TaxID=4577 RepID=C4IYV5_MAIZE|nr:unknown [Zea mays]